MITLSTVLALQSLDFFCYVRRECGCGLRSAEVCIAHLVFWFPLLLYFCLLQLASGGGALLLYINCSPI